MKELTARHVSELTEMLGRDRFSTGQSNRELHLRDISFHEGVLPAAVVWPESTADVAKVLSWAYENDVPVTPWGAGTSTEGNPVPTRGGIVVDMTRMDRVIEIRPGDLQADVQPGVHRIELNRQAGRHGLFFPPDPGADATIGGMIANNASGVQTVKYGATRDYVLRLTVVLPQGRVINTGCKAMKSSSGLDLTRLFVGSEGTLGIITEATLKLAGIPSHHLAAIIRFPDLEKASQAVAVLIGSGLGPAALELLPPRLIALMNNEKNLALPEVPSLFCEFHSVSESALMEIAQLARRLCEECGSIGFDHATEEAARKNLWKARHDAWETIHRAHPGKHTLIVDAAVPISRYPEMVVFAQRQVDSTGSTGYVFGHAGDGNLHVVLVGNPEDRDEWGRMEAVNHSVVEKAIHFGGTCTGEHGVGIGKRKFMHIEHGEAFSLMKQIKDVIDPKGLMNPGKIF